MHIIEHENKELYQGAYMTQDSSKDFFISYNKADRGWAEWIAWQLEAEGYTTVVQVWDFRPGSNFILEMQKATSLAKRTLALLSPSYLESIYTQPEWAADLVHDPTGEKGALLPVRVRPCQLKGIFTGVICINLVGMDEAEARAALLDGIRRTRAKTSTAPKFPGKLQQQSSHFPGTLSDVWNVPFSVTAQIPISTPSMIREQSNEKNPNQVIGTSPKVDWAEPLHTSQFYGRDKEIDQLKQWIIGDRCCMVAVLGIGGIGKTSLAVRLVEQIQEEFDYVFWRSLQNAPPLRSILQECTKFISDQQQIDLPEDVEGQISILMKYLQKYRTLLVLDNGESVLQAGDRVGQYRQGYEGYGRLLQRVGETRHQSCLLLTSREKPKEIALLEGGISPVHSLQVPRLEQAAGHKILKA